MSARRRDNGVPRLLITISGMDGAGKSTAAERASRGLSLAGISSQVVHLRFGNEGEILHRIASPVKRLLRRTETFADPVAAGGPDVVKVRDPRAAAGRRGPVSWTWILVVSAVTLRSFRRAAALRRSGASVICDRWVTDALVDLELRYGRHRAAEWLLRTFAPPADASFVIALDAETAAARKPGDQASYVWEGMERLYRARSDAEGMATIEGTLPAERIAGEIVARVTALTASVRSAPRPGGPAVDRE